MTKTTWFLLFWFSLIAIVIIGFIAFVLYNESVYPARKNLHSKEPYKRYSSIYKLTEAKDKKSIPEIRKLCNDTDIDVRHYAIYVLAYTWNDKECIPEIKQLLNDKNEQTRRLAEEALKKLGVPDEEIQKAKEK